MAKKSSIIRGTLILTMTGFLSRFMGFFYRIFMSHSFGEEGVGLYQLIFPVYALCYSLTTAGIETAISRTVACKISLGKEQEAHHVLYTGLLLSFFLSCISTIFLQDHAAYIANQLLGDARCQQLLVILSYTMPFSAVHSCICGYSFGKKQTKIPALSQLIEQTARITSVFFFCFMIQKQGGTASIAVAVGGLVLGEMVSALYTLHTFFRPFSRPEKKNATRSHLSLSGLFCGLKELLPLSLPLTANRVLLNLLQSIEAISIPGKLRQYHLSTSEALSLYGVLNGMALPCILFPSAITNSVSVMLMPTIAEIQTSKTKKELADLIKKVTAACFILGLSCCLFFLLTGSFIGMTLFNSRTAGKFIVTLAWMCPFLYTNSALLSVINGLGKTGSTFLINAAGLALRIGSVFYGIPRFGIRGYLWGLLLSQFTVTLFAVFVISASVSHCKTK